MAYVVIIFLSTIILSWLNQILTLLITGVLHGWYKAVFQSWPYSSQFHKTPCNWNSNKFPLFNQIFLFKVFIHKCAKFSREKDYSQYPTEARSNFLFSPVFDSKNNFIYAHISVLKVFKMLII